MQYEQHLQFPCLPCISFPKIFQRSLRFCQLQLPSSCSKLLMDRFGQGEGQFRHILQSRLKLQMVCILLLAFFLEGVRKFICRAWGLQQVRSILQSSFEQASWTFVLRVQNQSLILSRWSQCGRKGSEFQCMNSSPQVGMIIFSQQQSPLHFQPQYPKMFLLQQLLLMRFLFEEACLWLRRLSMKNRTCLKIIQILIKQKDSIYIYPYKLIEQLSFTLASNSKGLYRHLSEVCSFYKVKLKLKVQLRLFTYDWHDFEVSIMRALICSTENSRLYQHDPIYR